MDEYKKQLQDSQKIRLESGVFHLMINPTLDCNLHCWYCYEKHVKGSSISTDIMNGILGLISKNCIGQRNIKKLILSFFGGEPLLEFDSVRKIILHSSECCEKKNIWSRATAGKGIPPVFPGSRLRWREYARLSSCVASFEKTKVSSHVTAPIQPLETDHFPFFP